MTLDVQLVMTATRCKAKNSIKLFTSKALVTRLFWERDKLLLFTHILGTL